MIPLDFLTSSAGQMLLNRLETADLSDANRLKLVTDLRGDYNTEQIHAAITQTTLRQQAVLKFGPDAARLFFTPDALQQATDPWVRAYHGQQIINAHVLDLCCGIGADTIALAKYNAHVTGIDIDPVRVAIAQYNASQLGVDNVTFRQADVTQDDDWPPYTAVFFDPARRDASGRRIYDVRQYIPPLETIHRFRAPHKLVKISPGVDLAQVAEESADIQFISVKGELKEALLHYPGGGGRWATILIEPQVTLELFPEPAVERPPVLPPQGWLVEPDPALIRAGLIAELAFAIDGAQLDETIAYLTTDQYPVSHWLRAWRVLDWMPFHLKRLRAYLRERNVGHVTVKKRGSPLTPEGLTAKLKLKGAESRTLVLTRYAGDPIVVICADYTA